MKNLQLLISSPWDSFENFWTVAAPLNYGTLNATEDDKTFTIQVDVPGFKLADLSVTLNEQTLIITGKNKNREFSRSTRLWDEVNPNSVTASLSDGILSIVLEKRAKPKPVEIEIVQK